MFVTMLRMKTMMEKVTKNRKLVRQMSVPVTPQSAGSAENHMSNDFLQHPSKIMNYFKFFGPAPSGSLLVSSLPFFFLR